MEIKRLYHPSDEGSGPKTNKVSKEKDGNSSAPEATTTPKDGHSKTPAAEIPKENVHLDSSFVHLDTEPGY